MGTRNLTCVIMDGKYKVAQYGQWDGYPGGQGVTIYEFLTEVMKKKGLGKFGEKVRRCTYIDADKIPKLYEECGAEPNSQFVDDVVAEKFKDKYAHLYRDMAADILAVIYTSKVALELNDDLPFANEGLFCEWCYVIDLDAKRLKVYRGQYDEPHLASERFPGQVLLKDYALADLPSTSKEFVDELEGLADKSRASSKSVAK
jgi:hypothetical protein